MKWIVLESSQVFAQNAKVGNVNGSYQKHFLGLEGWNYK